MSEMLILKLSSGCMIAEIMVGVKAWPTGQGGRRCRGIDVHAKWVCPGSGKFVRGSMETVTNKVKRHRGQEAPAWHGIRGTCDSKSMHRLAGWKI